MVMTACSPRRALAASSRWGELSTALAERCSAGGSRSPATCAGNGPSPSTTCRWPQARRASTRPLPGIPPRPEGALGAEDARADDDQQDHVQQQLQRRTSCFVPAAEGDGQADVGGRGNSGHGNEYTASPDSRAAPSSTIRFRMP
jgi:hypothetical protein